MERTKNNFKVTREQIETIIEALGNAECWKIEMGERNPQYEPIYSEHIRQYIALEFELRNMIGEQL